MTFIQKNAQQETNKSTSQEQKQEEHLPIRHAEFHLRVANKPPAFDGEVRSFGFFATEAPKKVRAKGRAEDCPEALAQL